MAWLDSLRADAVFGWRQLRKRKVTSAAAVLSLALAIGACASAFRLIDALLLRPLPVSHPERLYVLSKTQNEDGWAYPLFRRMRAAVKEQADLIAISYAARTDLTFESDADVEKAYVQYVSGGMFSSFGLRPALGRLLSEDDDRTPGAHPVAVLSHDYWARRFGGDRKVIGRTLRAGSGNRVYEIVGVIEPPFTGTEPGTVTDIFIPAMMHRGVEDSEWLAFRTLAHLKPGAPIGPIRDRLQAVSQAYQEELAKRYPAMPKRQLDDFLNKKLLIEPAPAGFSPMQKEYRIALVSLGALVAMVLLIACANVANLMTAQAAARTREMALRVSIGARRWRLVQTLLVESALVAFLAAAIGAWFAWWSAPLVAGMINPPDDPVRLLLPADWRVLAFGLALTAGVTLFFGLVPALRASSIQPAIALKGGADPHARRRGMRMLLAAQVAFCFLVLLIAGLFVATFDRLSKQPLGFSADRLLALDTAAPRPQPPAFWDQTIDQLRGVPGVETVALAGFPLLGGGNWNAFISIDGAPANEALASFLGVSPGWLDAMKIPLIDGRDFRASDEDPGVAIVNGAFMKQYFKGENPVGKWIERAHASGARRRIQIVGLVRDARYHDVRGPIPPVAYVPFHGAALGQGTFIVRTSGSNPLALASVLRNEVSRALPGFRVRNIHTQAEINRSHTVRERLLATLATFFAAVALLLAGIGLYGVLDYTVVQRRREIGIRIAIGAQASDIARQLTVEVLSIVVAGALAGLLAGIAAVRFIETLLYQVKATDLSMLAVPSVTILVAALLAALPPVIRAVRIDPVAILRTE